MKKMNLKEYQDLLVKKFKLINKDFEEHNIFWWAHSGTLLGMIREKGMIPWDDDIDMGMSYKEYTENKDLIEKIAKKHNMELLDNQDMRSGHYPAKIIDKEYILVEWNGNTYYVQPHIDIMLALPKYVVSPFKAKLYCIPWQMITNIAVKRRHELLKKPNIYLGKKVAKVPKWLAWFYQLGYYFLPMKLIFFFIKRKYDKALKQKDWSELQFFIGADVNLWIFKPNQMKKISVWGEEVNISKNFAEEMTFWFGPNWMKRPKKEERAPHHIQIMRIDSLEEIIKIK